MKKYITPIIATSLLAAAILASALVGCTTSQVNVAYKSSIAADIGVKASLAGWNVYVGLKHPGTNAEIQVLNLFKTVKQAEITLVDAEASLAANPTNTAPYEAALAVYQATATDFSAVIASLTNSLPTH